jgi:hypothetical protein
MTNNRNGAETWLEERYPTPKPTHPVVSVLIVLAAVLAAFAVWVAVVVGPYLVMDVGMWLACRDGGSC